MKTGGLIASGAVLAVGLLFIYGRRKQAKADQEEFVEVIRRVNPGAIMIDGKLVLTEGMR